jgi:hypothetical protein
LKKSLVVLEYVEVEVLFGCFLPICQVACQDARFQFVAEKLGDFFSFVLKPLVEIVAQKIGVPNLEQKFNDHSD